MSNNYVAQGWKSLMVNGSHLSGKDHRAHGHREVVIAVNNRSELTTYQNLACLGSGSLTLNAKSSNKT